MTYAKGKDTQFELPEKLQSKVEVQAKVEIVVEIQQRFKNFIAPWEFRNLPYS